MLPAFQRHHTRAWQNSAGEIDRGGGGAALANTGLVASANQAASAGPCTSDSAAAPVPTGTTRHWENTPSSQPSALWHAQYPTTLSTGGIFPA